ATRLSREQRKHYGACFDELDINGDGSISASELMGTLAQLGVKMTERESYGMITLADADGNGGIERDEFMALMARFNGGEDGAGAAVAAYRRVFDAVDVNSDGGLELHELSAHIKEKGTAVDARDACAIFAEFDLNGDGIVDFPEFLTLM
ncbi:hypothetical protein AURANDRAFT_16268, partial [Aureococcus anophagefferens]